MVAQVFWQGIRAILDYFWYSTEYYSTSEINWNHELRFETFLVTLLWSKFDGDRFKRSNFRKKKKRESLCKLFSSTLCWFSISLSLFLNFSKDGLKLGSSLQHFVIISYLKHKDVMNISVCHWWLRNGPTYSRWTSFFGHKFPFFYNKGEKVYKTVITSW